MGVFILGAALEARQIMNLVVKRLCRWLASRMPGNGVRVWLLRRAGYVLGTGVYVGESLIVVDNDSDRGTVTVGDRVAIAPRVTLVTFSDPNNSRTRTRGPVRSGPIVLGNDVWIGTGVIVLPGITIGEGAVVGAGSVVTRDVSPFAVVAGSPARKLRQLDPTGALPESVAPFE
jgi:galactoside O-acetyltransferase